MTRARILHVSDYESLGGAEVVFRNTVAVSRRLGYRTEVAVADGSPNPISYVWSARNLSRFAAQLGELEPDVVHLQNFYHRWSPSILGAISRYRRTGRRLKVVMTAHDFHLVCPNSGMITYRGPNMLPAGPTTWRQLALHRYDRRSHAHSLLKKVQFAHAYLLHAYQREIDLILSPSRYLADVFTRCGITVPIELVRNPTPAGSAGEHPPHCERAGIVYFGRLTAEKGVFAAAAELSRAGLALDVYGTGDDAGRLADLAERDANIRLHGPVDHDQMMTELSRYNVMIMPSPAAENAPLSVIEAAQHGVRIVAVQGSGAAEMADLTEVARVYDPQQPGGLVRAVREMLASPATNRVLDPTAFAQATYQEALAGIYERLSV